MERITSLQNNTVKRLCALATQKKVRREQGLFVVEGAKLIEEAAQAGVAIHGLFFTAKALERWGEQLLPLCEQRVLITEEIAAKISEHPASPGVFALCPLLENTLGLDTIKGNGRYLLADSLQDPGNLGTIIRSCRAFGIDGLILSADCPDLHTSKVLRGSMGGVFTLPIWVSENLADTVQALQQKGLPVYAAALAKEAMPLHQLSLGGGHGILLGREGSGLPPDLIQACTGQVLIPMEPMAESLNVAVAAGILLWESYRRGLAGHAGICG